MLTLSCLVHKHQYIMEVEVKRMWSFHAPGFSPIYLVCNILPGETTSVQILRFFSD